MNKAYSFTRHFFIATFLVFIAQVSWASIYTTLNPGNWDDPNSWDCACIPPNPLPGGDQVTISHLITISTGVSKTINTDATLNIESTLINEGIINVEPNGNFRIVAGGTFSNTGTLNHSGNMSLENNPASLPSGTFNWITGIIDVTFGVSLTVNSPFTIPGGCSMNLTFGTLVNNSTINVTGSLGLIFGGSVDNSNGILNINPGGLLAHVFGNYGPISQGTFNWNSGGTILTSGNATYTTSSHMTIEPGRIFWVDAGSSLVNNSTITNNGTLKGSGTFSQNGTFNNNSSIAPGSSPGTFSVAGSIDLGTGTYDCEINGTTAGSQYDVISVTGNAVLTNASLVVDWGSFTPSSGQSFTIMNFGSRTGEFASVTIPSKGGLDWEVEYSASTVVVKQQGVLPVELGDFSAEAENQKVLLNWETYFEIDNKGFDVERSVDGKNWLPIGYVAGRGNSLELNQYAFTDYQPYSSLNYYRLRQIDFNNASSFSNVVSIDFSEAGGMRIFPNPVTSGMVNISIQSKTTGPADCKIYDSNGKLVGKSGVFLESDNPLNVDVSNLTAGMYVLEIVKGGERWQQQFLVE